MILLFLVIELIGLITLVFYPNMESSKALPHLINEILPTGFKGLVGAIMSTADSFLNSGSVAIVNDVIKELSPKIVKYEMILLKVFSLIKGLFAIFVALSSSSILGIGASLTSIWTTTILLPMFLSMIGYHVSKTGFLLLYLVVLAHILFGSFVALKQALVSIQC